MIRTTLNFAARIFSIAVALMSTTGLLLATGTASAQTQITVTGTPLSDRALITVFLAGPSPFTRYVELDRGSTIAVVTEELEAALASIPGLQVSKTADDALRATLPQESRLQVHLTGTDATVHVCESGPENIDELLSTADKAYAAKDYAAALPVFLDNRDACAMDATRLARAAWMLQTGKSVEKQPAAAVTLWERVRNGDAGFGHYFLGNNLAAGKQFSVNYPLAISHYERAAEMGFGRAHFRLATIFDQGPGTAVDFPRAFEHLKACADKKGSAQTNCQYYLGVYHLNGKHGEKDIEAAETLFLQAAEKGSLAARSDLGILYRESGRMQEAFEQTQLAAEGGNKSAQNNLGWHFENGQGIARDLDQARSWYRKAADQGNEKAIANLKRLGS